MLTLHELRDICCTVLNFRPMFRSLLMAALHYDREEFENLCGRLRYPISLLLEKLKRQSNLSPEEERLVVELIIHEQSPNDLHLLLGLCRKNVPLRTELEESGLNFELLELLLIERLSKEMSKNAVIPSTVLERSLTDLSTSRNN
jgi:hypothetical protein